MGILVPLAPLSTLGSLSELGALSRYILVTSQAILGVQFPAQYLHFYLRPALVGLIFCFWGYFTTVWPTNLFGGSDVWMSGWDLVFAFPYLLVGSVLLWKCFRKYDWVYVGSTSFKSRRFGFMSIVFFLALEMIFIIVVSNTPHSLMLPLVHETIDLMLLVSIFSSSLCLFITVFSGGNLQSHASHKEGSRPRPRVPATSAHTGSQVYTRTGSGQQTCVSCFPKEVHGNPSGDSTRTDGSLPPGTTAVDDQKQGPVAAKPKVRAVPYDKLKPKAGVLSAEDFKCIFCFQHPKVPEDANRGVVLCPNCRYPAPRGRIPQLDEEFQPLLALRAHHLLRVPPATRSHLRGRIRGSDQRNFTGGREAVNVHGGEKASLYSPRKRAEP